MAPERIELTSGLGVEGLSLVSTAQVVRGQSLSRAGERKERENKPRRSALPADDAPAEILELSGDSTANQDPAQEQKQDLGQDQDDDRLPHRIDSLA